MRYAFGINNISYTRDVARYTKLYEAAPDLPTTPWEAAAVTRGEQIHEIRGQTLPRTFPVIDRFKNGVATSIKSIDLNAPSYQEPARLEGRINAYVNKLRDYNGTKWKTIQIKPKDITSRVLDIVVPKGAGTSVQRAAIERARRRAWSFGIATDVTPY